jgi:hypothetical protein
MPKSSPEIEIRIANALEAYRTSDKPNVKALEREFDVSSDSYMVESRVASLPKRVMALIGL